MDLSRIKADYARDGYTVIKDMIPPDLLAELAAETERLVAVARDRAQVGRQFDVIDTATGPDLRRVAAPETAARAHDRAMRFAPLQPSPVPDPATVAAGGKGQPDRVDLRGAGGAGRRAVLT